MAEQTEDKRLRPLFTVKTQDEEALLGWLKLAKDSVLKVNNARLREMKDHNELYSGDHWSNIDEERRNNPDQQKSQETADLTINHLFDLTENRISRLTRFKPNVAVLPANSEEVSDRAATPLVKELIDYWQYCNDFDDLMQKRIRHTDIFGQSFIFVEWDERKGPLYPAAKKKGETLHIGDVSFRIANPYDVFLEPTPTNKYEDVEWVLERKKVDIDKLKFKYKKKKHLIEKKETAGNLYEEDDVWDLLLEDEFKDNSIYVWTLWHKSTPELPEGHYAVFTDNVVLEAIPLKEKYEHGKLPIVRVTGIDVPGKLDGTSIYTHAKQMNHIIDVMFTMAYRNMVLGANPKWTVPRSANVEENQLGNDFTVLEYDGQTPPSLQTYQTVSPELFNMAQEMKETVQQFMGVFGVSRGEPPPGVKAGIAMQFLNEQENERYNQDVNKHNNAIKSLWLLALDVARQYYDEDDNRLIQVFGEEREYTVKKFDPSKLNTKYDVRVQNSGSLSSSKAGRMQQILDFEEIKPGLIPDEVVVDMLDLGIPEAYTSYITKPFKAANIENEDLANGVPVQEPAKWEDHLSHWKQHFSFMQSADFKNMKPKIKEMFEDHLRVHEMFLIDLAFFDGNLMMPKNPALAEILSTTLPIFPVVFEVAMPPPPPPPGPSPDELADIEAAKANHNQPEVLADEFTPDPLLMEDPLDEGAPIDEPPPII